MKTKSNLIRNSYIIILLFVFSFLGRNSIAREPSFKTFNKKVYRLKAYYHDAKYYPINKSHLRYGIRNVYFAMNNTIINGNMITRVAVAQPPKFKSKSAFKGRIHYYFQIRLRQPEVLYFCFSGQKAD